MSVAMLALTAAMYAVTPIPIPSGFVPALFGNSIASNHPAGISKPQTIALSARGSVAVLLNGPNGTDTILIRRADESETLLHLPSNSKLRQQLYHFEPGISRAHFLNVALADDGTPFATVGAEFSGAYTGEDEATFRWGGEWTTPFPPRSRFDLTNTSVAAVSDSTTFWFTVNYYNQVGNVDAASSGALRNEAHRMVAGRQELLGSGDVLAGRGRFSVGFDAHLGRFGVAPGEPVVALRWADRRPTVLGNGVAYDVNALGDAVGNDKPNLISEGHPTLWHRGRTVRLTDAVGSAYAIGDDGTIVGTVTHHAFFATAYPNLRIARIDARLRDTGWTINAAYAIARDGRILGVGHHLGQPPALVLLDPR